MKKQRKRIEIKLTSILIIIGIIAVILSVPTFGRYIYKGIRNMYLSSKNFYFTSSILSEDSSDVIIATYNDWGGLENYIVNIRMYSYDNEKQRMTTDLAYNVKCEVLDDYKDTVDCAINTIEKESNGKYVTETSRDILVSNGNEDSLNIYVIPKRDLSTDEEIRIRITAWTDVPYEKELSGIISVRVGGGSVEDYSLSDAEYQQYATLTIRNINDTERKITITVDATKLRIDMNDDLMKNATILETKKINGSNYAKKIQATLKAESAKAIKLYKVDKTKTYEVPSDEIQISFN